MNDLDVLRAFRADVPEPQGDDLRRGEARLAAALRTRRSAVVARRRLRPVWGVGLAAGLAATVAVTAVVARPDGGADTPAARPPVGDAPGLRPVSAIEVLDRAALAASTTPEIAPRADQFIVYESMTMYVSYGPDSRYLYRTRRTIWQSADGTRVGALRVESLEPRVIPGSPIPAHARRDVGQVEMLPLPVCGPRDAGDRTDYMYLRTLSTDPARMLEYLRSRPSGDPDPDRRAFTAAGDLIRESYLPPAQRAALFQAIKLIPGIVVVPDAQDSAGRGGVAVARVDTSTGIRHELIFDPQTYRYLGERAYVVAEVSGEPVKLAPGGSKPATGEGVRAAPIPIGTQVAGTAELSVTVADKAPSVPSGPKGGCG